MKKLKQQFLLVMGILFFCPSVFGQKPPIDSSVYNRWPAAAGPTISNDGKYFLYYIQNQPTGGSTAIIKSTTTNWEVQLLNTNCEFTQDSHNFIFSKNDSLGIGTMGISSIKYITGVNNFQFIKYGEKRDWLVYKKNSQPDDLIVQNPQNGAETTYAHVTDYWFSDNGAKAILETKLPDRKDQQLELLDPVTSEKRIIWEGHLKNKVLFSADGRFLTFVSSDDADHNSIWSYQVEDDKAIKLTDDHQAGLPAGATITAVTAVGKNKSLIFFTWQLQDRPITAPYYAGINVWSYKDSKLQSQQIKELKKSKQEYVAVLNIPKQHIFLLEDKDHKVLAHSLTNYSLDNVLILKSENGGVGWEWNWNPHAKCSVYLLSLIDGDQRSISKTLDSIPTLNLCQMSPDGKYVIYFDPFRENYFSYSVLTGICKNITQSIPAVWTSYTHDDEPTASHYPIGIAGFVEEDHAVLMYSRQDIYQVDLSGNAAAINLTNAYGLKHNIIFRSISTSRNTVFGGHENVIVSAFNQTTKDDGFYEMTVGQQKTPVLLSMQACALTLSESGGDHWQPIKARDTGIYIVRKMTAATAPNYFFTRDFKHFNALTSVYPEKNYNWLTSELVTWKTPDGQPVQGILYKPENFDPRKKYPLIITYYEKISETLHAYIKPIPAGGPMEIPLYVSNGYLVFTPDIHFKIGRPGRSSYNTVVSAAQYLSQRPYVNAKKIGLQGHSWGGFQTNYIITHSHLFAAAMSSSGMSDFVSIYGSVVDGESRQRQYELRRDRMGATLWQIPNLYIENSPVLRADQVTTPLLMMANEKDGDVPYAQGIEFFTALRRLQKKVWMLEYDGGNHMVFDKAGDDLTLRMFQFFNYYLKDASPPKWMTEGIPAKLKGIDSGLEFDNSGARP